MREAIGLSYMCHILYIMCTAAYGRGHDRIIFFYWTIFISFKKTMFNPYFRRTPLMALLMTGGMIFASTVSIAARIADDGDDGNDGAILFLPCRKT